MSITLTITGDDPKFPAVLAAVTGTATSGGTSGGTAAPATDPTVSGTVLLPGNPSGILTDLFGEKFQWNYNPAEEFNDIMCNGSKVGSGTALYYYWAPNNADGSPNHQVWLANTAVNPPWYGVFVSGAFVNQPALPVIPNGPVIVNPPPVPPAGSVVPAATPVTATATGMAAAIAAGVSVTLAAGVYTETAAITAPMTLSGQGIGTTTINITGIKPDQNKAALVPSIPGVTIKAMSITGAAIDNSLGGNAAGVRDGGDGIGFTLKTVEISGCQMGVLTFASPIVIDTSHIHDNGNATAGARTHNIYCGGGTLTLTNSVVEHCADAHEVKSRATDTTLTGDTITTAGRGNCIDIPDAGNLTVSNTTLTIGKAADPSNQNEVVLHYGEESTKNAGRAVALTSVVIDTTALPGVSALLIFAAADAKLTLTGCTYKGDTAPTIQGLAAAQITGAFTKAA